MGKIILFTVFFWFNESGVFAQLTPVQFGLEVGKNLSVPKTDDQASGQRTAYDAGGGGTHQFKQTFCFATGRFYSSQRGEYSTSTIRLNCNNVPVLGQYMFVNGLRLRQSCK